jgi:hypothetical protein
MRDRILLPFCRGVMAAMLLAAVVLPADAADLDARTVEAYKRYVAAVEATFVGQLDGDAFLTAETPSTGTGTLKRDTVRVRPGAGDGYRVLLRMKGSAGGVESTVDLWTTVESGIRDQIGLRQSPRRSASGRSRTRASGTSICCHRGPAAGISGAPPCWPGISSGIEP